MSRIVVFGGSGFLGSAIAAGIEGTVAPPRSQVDLTNANSVRDFLRAGDRVINAAGYASATDRSDAGRARLRRENVDAVRILADECVRANAGQLIHLSSVAAMGPKTGAGVSECEATEPRSPYAVSKRDAERVLGGISSLPVTILRPTSVFGVGRPLATMLCRIAGLPVVPLPDGGRAMIPFTYVGNVAAAVRLAVGRESCFGRTFIVGDAQSYPLREIIEGLARGQGRGRVRVVPIPGAILRLAATAELRLRGERSAPLLDPSRIDTMTRSVSYSIKAFQAVSGYVPPISLEEATRQIGARYVRRSGDA